MDYIYKGKKYDLYLNEDGKIACTEDDLDVAGETIEEVKGLIRAAVKAEGKAEKVDVLIRMYGGFVEGTTKFGVTGNRIWVTYTREGKTHREVVWRDKVFVNSEDNKNKIARINELQEKCYALEQEIGSVEDSLEAI